jgi:Secretion system C-terminal sorting domain
MLPALRHYEIWKQKNGTWSLLAITPNPVTTNYTDESELTIAPSLTVYYKVCAVDLAGQKTGFSNVVGIGVKGGLFKMNPNAEDSVQFFIVQPPSSLQVMQNYPNPFNPSTRILFGLPEADHVLLQVFDITGQLVSTLIDDYIGAGYHSVYFNAQKLSSGIYIYKITTTKNTIVKRMLLLK